MSDVQAFFKEHWPLMQQADLFLPRENPTAQNPAWERATLRVLIVRLSPYRDVERSTPHLFLAQAARRGIPAAYVDFAFFPQKHDRERLTTAGIPLLTGIFSWHPVQDFDLVLISNAYTLELLNLPYLLQRSGVPCYASARDESWPPFLLGGSNALAAQALLTPEGDALVDGLFFGEGEREVKKLLQFLAENAAIPKRERLRRAAASVTGLWVANEPGQRVRKAICASPGVEHALVDYPLLNGAEAGVGRLQIGYGCPAFCAFCFEGYDRKPYRELSRETVLAAARALKIQQGVETLELYSFNFNTHADILSLLLDLNRLFRRVSFKSQRVDLLYTTPGLLAAELLAEKQSFTLGIEGISGRQRAFLHKSLPDEALWGVLAALLREKVRELKLFYILTGHETEADLAEFRDFARQLKGLVGRFNPGLRVIFSFGMLIRMPFTPLRYDRLFLDEAECRPVVGAAKSACETNGFEFRLATPWDEYAVSQVLALGGDWLHAPLVALAEQGHCYDLTLTPGYWEALRAWLEAQGQWTPEFLGEKGPDTAFPLEFVNTGLAAGFLWRQYEQARAAVDEGYCLGATCLGCGACTPAQRAALTGHAPHLPDDPRYLATLQETVRAKRRLEPVYVQLYVPEQVAGASPEWLNAYFFRRLLAILPEQAENLLAVRESRFNVGGNAGRFPCWYGWSTFALTAWEPEALMATLEAYRQGDFVTFAAVECFAANPSSRVACLGLQTSCVFPELFFEEELDPFYVQVPYDVAYGGPVRGETLEELRLRFRLPLAHFPDAAQQLRAFLQKNYVPTNLRRWDAGGRFDIPEKSQKKKSLLRGDYREVDGNWDFLLEVGPKFDLRGYLRSFAGPDRAREVRVLVSPRPKPDPLWGMVP